MPYPAVDTACEIVRISALSAPDIRVYACLDVDHGGFLVETEAPVENGRLVQFEFQTSTGLAVTLPARAVDVIQAGIGHPQSHWEFIVESATRDAIGLLATSLRPRLMPMP